MKPHLLLLLLLTLTGCESAHGFGKIVECGMEQKLEEANKL